jgi:hypothetical protein
MPTREALLVRKVMIAKVRCPWGTSQMVCGVEVGVMPVAWFRSASRFVILSNPGFQIRVLRCPHYWATALPLTGNRPASPRIRCRWCRSVPALDPSPAPSAVYFLLTVKARHFAYLGGKSPYNSSGSRTSAHPGHEGVGPTFGASFMGWWTEITTSSSHPQETAPTPTVIQL